MLNYYRPQDVSRHRTQSNFRFQTNLELVEAALPQGGGYD